MIKIGLTGGETKTAAELLRLAIHHPDIEISTIHSPANAGKSVASLHHGFIGEEKLLFSSNLDATGLDVVFLITPLYTSSDWAKLMADCKDLNLVVFPEAAHLTESLSTTPTLGLSEMYRKPLVRGERVAILPSPLESAVLVALYPLAAHLMLPSAIKIKISAPSDLLTDDTKSRLSDLVVSRLKSIQSSFNADIDIQYEAIESDRSMRIVIELPGSTAVDQIMKIYDSIYDDHNFTFMTTRPVGIEEVEGTQRMVLSFSKPQNDTLRIEGVADARMRGGAGEAIHVMNLMQHLHEKTGLEQKVNRW